MIKKTPLFFLFFLILFLTSYAKEDQKQQSIDSIETLIGKATKIEDLKNLYDLQRSLVIEKQEELEYQNKLLAKQQAFFDKQKYKINEQDVVLNVQKKRLELHQNITMLLLFVMVLGLCFIFFVYKTRAKEKKLSQELEQKNKKIEKVAIQLKRQNKELEQFAYIASHDLQEPLHTVSSFADFMIQDYENEIDGTGKQYLNYMKDGCQRMSNLIKALLDHSKIGVTMTIVPVKIEYLLKEITDDFASLIQKTNAQITYGGTPVIEGYEVELRLLFQNLISNAIKFRKTNTQPIIHVEGKKLASTTEFLDCWQFSVKDNGIGIAREHHEKIFSIFQRLHNREAYTGTGIGLAHCEKIVSLHNGNIWVFSKPNEGATFYFTIQVNKKNSIAA